MGMLPAYHWEARLEVQPLLVVPGTGPLPCPFELQVRCCCVVNIPRNHQ